MNQPGTLKGIHVIIPAGGLGTRMGADIPKQYLPLLGQPILQHTLATLLALQPASLTVAVSQDDIWFAQLDAANQCRVVPGGAERQHSVQNALVSLEVHERSWVMVHDAVRPCVSTEDITALVTELEDSEVGGLLAVPVADTLKRVSGRSVSQTVDRSGLWRALTPQMFRYDILKEALARTDTGITDEASAVERTGHSPTVVAGSVDNIKITTASDLRLAEQILKSRQ